MSKKYPECPLYNHDTCKELHNPKLCAIIRKDKICLRKLPKSARRTKPLGPRFEAKKITKGNEHQKHKKKNRSSWMKTAKTQPKKEVQSES